MRRIYVYVNRRRKCQGLLFINTIPEESNDERKNNVIILSINEHIPC